MRVLGIDTSTLKTCAGLIDDGKDIASFELSSNMFNSEELVEMVGDIFKKLDYKLKDIDLIAVGIGPGSFTGTRIAVTIARTFAQTLGIEIKGVSSLKAMALNYEGEGIILPLFDAKRGRAYYGIYKNQGEIENLKEDSLKHIDEIMEELREFKEEIVVLGPGRDVFLENLQKEFKVVKYKDGMIHGTNVAHLGQLEYGKFGGDNLFEVLPNYINPSQAEREFGKKTRC
ncbi:tRNA (adenosine(37)-N6)-threonylcarbamoyltransferase complex dimerization subunit type 1 TsaB [Anaerosphaera multitolerans]|uniref:tRNA (Adenosine(37)-N6)-threonylcarbamoyltransferase complex dimerization subunit type 1 TsaB n=1 Tax=Anaerosphaera multitolerans TaxID=2487351 RepID=A0A437S7K3_9FIRM|nr:tRNA (adenosine(37)-N6)-threonylcarbamoyltransferase complex dimerization subunit type 1 TsaB [Anaerosphaera multitolerans]RVU55055.1 tRNA (adenosine(37)-N6)-threonylcarbamoyltransferase complex dimerization subunit type 1 TsaB [Anaerosphaera multitolerans]